MIRGKSGFGARSPSKVTDAPWLYAFRVLGGYPKHTIRGGKWLLFVKGDDVDRVWAQVKKAVEGGELGGQAKVSTARVSQHGSGKTHVICVYTYDSDDQADVMRVRDRLRTLGFNTPLSYKTDQATKAGKYASSGDRVISKYRC